MTNLEPKLTFYFEAERTAAIRYGFGCSALFGVRTDRCAGDRSSLRIGHTAGQDG